jgi:hypothetical protein
LPIPPALRRLRLYCTTGGSGQPEPFHFLQFSSTNPATWYTQCACPFMRPPPLPLLHPTRAGACPSRPTPYTESFFRLLLKKAVRLVGIQRISRIFGRSHTDHQPFHVSKLWDQDQPPACATPPPPALPVHRAAARRAFRRTPVPVSNIPGWVAAVIKQAVLL